MKTITRSSGLLITAPNSVEVSTPAPATAKKSTRTATRGATPLSGTGQGSEVGNILRALEKSDYKIVDRVELKRGPDVATAAGSRKRAVPTADGNVVRLEVPLQPSEGAVILVERDGMYSWQIASGGANVALPQDTRRGATRAPAKPRSAVFEIELTREAGSSPPGAKRRSIATFVWGQVRTYVLKFVADVVIKEGVKFQERDVRKGFIDMSGADATKWPLLDSLDSLAWPKDRPPRILLFVHGTFSSTIGGFGALAVTPSGKDFLAAARARYDAIIGFDHPTLSVSPLENAAAMLAGLEGRKWPQAPQVDVIAHSRGGLVIRSLLENLLPASGLELGVGRVVFVACTNQGTLLAEPDNWKDLVDLYTNLTAGLCRFLELFPQTTVAGKVLDETVTCIGSFVKLLVVEATTGKDAPGIAAMEPKGTFVVNINGQQAGQPTPEDSNYFVIESNFESKLVGNDDPPEFSARFKQMLADGFIDRLMQNADNDLVVNTSSMGAIDVAFGKYIKGTYDFGTNPHVYHTNYFTRQETVNALAGWLGMPLLASKAITRAIPPVKRPDAGIKKIAAPVAPPAPPRKKTIKRRAPTVSWSGGTGAGDMMTMAMPPAPSAAPKKKTIKRKSPSVRGSTGGSRTKPQKKKPTRTGVGGSAPGSANRPKVPKRPIKKAAKKKPAPKKKAAKRKPGKKKAAKKKPAKAAPKFPRRKSAPKPLAKRAAPRSPAKRAAPKSPAKKSADKPSIKRSARKPPSAAPPTVKRGRPAEIVEKPGTRTAVVNVRAAMDESVIVNTVAKIDVVVSREAIEEALGATAAEDSMVVELDRKILVKVVPRTNFSMSRDESGIEIDVPEADKPKTLSFEVKATDLGDAEVWVTFRQGQVQLALLKLHPTIVKSLTKTVKKIDVKGETIDAPALAQPLNQLTIEERVNGDQITYQFEFVSEALGARDWSSSAPIRGDRESYVSDLYKRIEDRWVSANRDAENFAQELRAFGAELFDELIPATLQKLLWEKRDAIKSIQVISTEPFIPWELVHLRNPAKKGLPDETRFLGQMGLIRWILGAGEHNWPVDAIKIRRDKAFYVAPDYPDPAYVLDAVKGESAYLREKFSATALKAESGKVREFISRPGRFDLLHFACHGDADSKSISDAMLLMTGRMEKDGNGEMQYIKDGFTATVASANCNIEDEDNSPMIVLNACRLGRMGYKLTSIGGFAQAFLKGGAGAFVGALWSVGDQAASTFTEKMYDALLDKKTLAEATIAARAAAQKAKDATWLAYVVYGHPNMRISR